MLTASQIARVLVPDPRFDWLCDLFKPKSQVPAHLTITDIAGLTAVSLALHPYVYVGALACWALV